MPDINKIFKDLELKAVGLDPTTQAMQEGYFTSFRSVGLPIHSEDYTNPWSPLGANLAKDVAVPPPADPATAPKTASGALSDNAVLTAKIGHDMQSYLMGFMLTDSQLRMNSSYAVMPGAANVSDAWYAIITGANGIPTDSVIKPELKAAYDAASAKLQDADGNVTPHYAAYMQYEDAWKDKVRDWHKAYADAFTDPMKLQNWPINGTSYEDDANEAMDRWVALGFKHEIEQAIDTLAAQGTDPAIALIARAKKRYLNSLNEFASIGEIPYTMMSPLSWYDAGDDEGWNTYTSTDEHSEVHYTASSTSYGGGASLDVGFWSVGGSFEHDEQHQELKVSSSDIDISFSYCAVDVKRPWMDSTLLSLRNWFLMGDYKKNTISDGTMGQQRSTVDPTFFPSVVTSLILVKGLHITWSTYASDWSQMSESTHAGGSIGYGPFCVHGHYDHADSSMDFVADTEGEGLHVKGIQLLGYVSMINPASPAIDSSEYTQKAPAPATPAAAPADAPAAAPAAAAPAPAAG